jgi:hypothetical protein
MHPKAQDPKEPSISLFLVGNSKGLLMSIQHFYSSLLPSFTHSDFFFCLQVFFDQISNFGLSVLHTSIYLCIVPFISSMTTAM